MKKRPYITPYIRVLSTDFEDYMLAVTPDIPYAGDDDPEKDPEEIPEAE